MCTHDDATLYDGIGVLVEPDLDPRLGLQKPEDEVLFGVDDGWERRESARLDVGRDARSRRDPIGGARLGLFCGSDGWTHDRLGHDALHFSRHGR